VGRASLALFPVAMIAAAGYIVATAPGLPEHVATHFGGSGAADAWMTRAGYVRFMLVFVVVLPALLVAAIGLLPRLFPQWVNVPNRAYWLAPERRDDSLAFLLVHACWFGVLMEVFVAALHALLLHANATSPPRLPTLPFVAFLAAFLAALAVWIRALYRRFPRPP
jgi:uncharacterized membrane protein